MAEKFNYTSKLAPFLNQLLNTKLAAGCSPLPIQWILKEFDGFANQVGLDVAEITEDLILSWRQSRLNDSVATLRKKYSVWAQLSKLMNRQGYKSFVPKLPHEPKYSFTPYIFTAEQMTTIFDICDSERLKHISTGTCLMAMPALLRLLYSTGMRISEALSIKNKDANFKQGYIHLHKTKNGIERLVPLCDSMLSVLREYVDNRNKMPVAGIASPNSYLFVRPNGTTITSESVYAFFKNILKKAGIPHIGNHHGPRVHDLRHTSACHALAMLAKKDIDFYTALPLISARLGHASLSATEQYVRLTSSMYPDLIKQTTPINAFVYPKTGKIYDLNDN